MRGDIIVNSKYIPFIEDGYLRNVRFRSDDKAVSLLTPEGGPGTTSARGWLAGDHRDVRCTAHENAYFIEVSGIGTFSVDRHTAEVTRVSVEPGVSSELFEEAQLGPPLTFSLALRDIWCLHASAVVIEGRATLFVGPSGAGKSTLAAYFAAQGQGSTVRASDDITACTLVEGMGLVLPDFPQMKLDPAEHYPSDAPDQLPIQSIIVLDATDSSQKARLTPMPSIRLINELIKQTVAVTLFDPSMHIRHLEFVAGLAQSANLRELRYPHDYSQLPDIYRWLTL